jgi:hypothetical protein
MAEITKEQTEEQKLFDNIYRFFHYDNEKSVYHPGFDGFSNAKKKYIVKQKQKQKQKKKQKQKQFVIYLLMKKNLNIYYLKLI